MRPRDGLPEAVPFSDYLRFRFFKKISRDVKEYLEADYQYYSGKREYCFPARISPAKQIAAGMMLKLSMELIREIAQAE